MGVINSLIQGVYNNWFYISILVTSSQCKVFRTFVLNYSYGVSFTGDELNIIEALRLNFYNLKDP